MKNKRAYIEQMKQREYKKQLYKEVQFVTPSLYACFAIALKQRGHTTKYIQKLFDEVGELWRDSLHDDRDMLQICFDETGIDIRQRVEE